MTDGDRQSGLQCRALHFIGEIDVEHDGEQRIGFEKKQGVHTEIKRHDPERCLGHHHDR